MLMPMPHRKHGTTSTSSSSSSSSSQSRQHRSPARQRPPQPHASPPPPPATPARPPPYHTPASHPPPHRHRTTTPPSAPTRSPPRPRPASARGPARPARHRRRCAPSSPSSSRRRHGRCRRAPGRATPCSPAEARRRRWSSRTAPTRYLSSSRPRSSRDPSRASSSRTWCSSTSNRTLGGRRSGLSTPQSFSSVVGPNGSGKSNVIDSLLFVFGFRASKMRQGKISALIHNSAQHPHLDHCEVQVHFRSVLDTPGGGDPTPLPDSTLVVSRRAFKNNSSKYYINGGASDFTAVTGLLRARGIDLDHKRFLILQGEVESIAQMKPKAAAGSDDGLLEYLEDIIGTSKYKSSIEESAAQAEELNEVCVEKQGRVAHVEKEKLALEGRKDAALEYLQDENELALKKGALYQLFVGECEQNVAVTGGVVAQVQARLDEELERRGGSEQGIRRLEDKYKEGAREVEEVEAATKAILKEMSRNDKENVKFQEKEKFLTQKQKKLQKSIQTNKLAASEATSMIEKHASDIARHSAEIASHEQNLAVQEAELDRIRDTLKEKTQGFSDQIAAKQKSLEPWKEKINEKQSAIAVAQSELDILHEKANASNNALEEARAKITAIQTARATKEQELKECRKELGRLEKEAAKVEASLEAMAAQEAPLRTNLSGARQKADEAKASLAATQTQGNVLTALMRLKESGRIEGFHGRLGNLGTIDARYDVAISTACPQLDNMVVDTVDAGQRAIDHLRKNNLGRANFICLDKLPNRSLAPIPTPENVPRLFDLVNPKTPALAPAFYNVLQNTLVAADLAQANRIAYGAQRWRVVTLTGQLIDKSGTLTGGGSTISRGRMSSKLAAATTREQVTQLEVDRDAQERAYTDFTAQQRELATTLRDLRERIPETQTAISKIELELSSAARHHADAEKRVKELTARGRRSAAGDESAGRIRTLEQHVGALEAEIAGLHAETAGLEAEIRALQDRIMSAGGIQLRSQKGKVDGLREQLELASEQVAAADLARVKAGKNLSKAQRAHEAGVAELDAAAAELEALTGEIQVHQLACQESAARAEEAAAYLEEKKEGLAALKAELDERTAELNKTRAAEIEMKNKLEEHHKVLIDNQKRSAHWQKELSKLSLHSIAGLTGGGGGGEGEGEGEGDPMDEDTEMPVYSRDELNDLDKAQLTAQIATLEEKLSAASVDLSVLGEYRRRVTEHAARAADLSTAVTARDGIKARLDDLRRRRLEEFMAGFSAISLRLKEMYQMITMGGNAELELVDSLDPFSEGILFSVMPPKKSWKNISNLSGGEKTLSSLALVFALHHYKPTPLYVMDEIDAALDFRNVSIVASYIKERTKNAQFIVISLRNNMFELAERLVGVYKVNHMTKSVTIENRDYIEKR
ncbi:RecF/RecN/SMC [Morchella snyderi]|nr:RecF/RecN/SMC [Morchella snyderi]